MGNYLYCYFANGSEIFWIDFIVFSEISMFSKTYISEEHNKMNNLIHESFNKFIIFWNYNLLKTARLQYN